MSFSINGSYYNMPKQKVALVNKETTDAEGNKVMTQTFERVVEKKPQGQSIASVPYLSGAYDYM
jgi:hypothetical protein